MKSSNLFGGFIFSYYLCNRKSVITKTATNMITVMTKNGVKLFISLTDDCDDDNKGGYFCMVYLDENDYFEYDNFVIHRDDYRTIEECCIAYANELDDSSILNANMNKAYDVVDDAYEHIKQFYLNHIVFNTNCDDAVRQQFKDLFDKMCEVKELSHELAEHFTWD